MAASVASSGYLSSVSSYRSNPLVYGYYIDSVSSQTDHAHFVPYGSQHRQFHDQLYEFKHNNTHDNEQNIFITEILTDFNSKLSDKYYRILINNGYNDLSSFNDVQEDDLLKIGIAKEHCSMLIIKMRKSCEKHGISSPCGNGSDCDCRYDRSFAQQGTSSLSDNAEPQLNNNSNEYKSNDNNNKQNNWYRNSNNNKGNKYNNNEYKSYDNNYNSKGNELKINNTNNRKSYNNNRHQNENSKLYNENKNDSNNNYNNNHRSHSQRYCNYEPEEPSELEWIYKNKLTCCYEYKKEADESTPTINIGEFLEQRHKQYQQDMTKAIYPINRDEWRCYVHNSENCAHRRKAFDAMNSLCRYCLMEPWSESHKQNCWGIPLFVQEGEDKPDESLYNSA